MVKEEDGGDERMKVRKISTTNSGARLINLAGFIPSSWEYVEVETLKSGKDEIVLKLSLLKVREVEPKNTQEV